MDDLKQGDVISGPYLVARNSATSGIHTDAFAQSQGFKRAVVAGPNHLAFVSTLIEERLGAAWLERGRLAVRFTAPIYDGDQARALITVQETSDSFAATFQTENGEAVICARGTAGWTPADAEASVPPPEPSSPVAELLDLAAIEPGERIPTDTVTADGAEVARYCAQNHDHLARPGRVPVPYLSPLLFAPARRFLTARGVGPGMWGAIEIRQYRPLRSNTPYGYEGTVLSRRRRGSLEIIDFLFTAHVQSGEPVCAISHSHLITHRAAST
jgi:hypothetical protein